MRSLILLLLAGILFAADQVPQAAQLSLLDPADAPRIDDPTHGRLFVGFCGVCPSARKTMSTAIKEITLAVNQFRAPLEVICYTPEHQGEALESYAKSVGVEGAIFAYDAHNPQGIGLNNILQIRFVPGKGGKPLSLSWKNPRDILPLIRDPARHNELGSFFFSPQGLDDPAVQALWWMLERGQVRAVSALVQSAKRTQPGTAQGDQVRSLQAAVEQAMTSERESLLAKEGNFETYEALEKHSQTYRGLDTTAVSERLKDLRKDALVRRELQARALYQDLIGLAPGRSKKEQDKVAAMRKALREQFGDTVYGKRAL